MCSFKASQLVNTLDLQKGQVYVVCVGFTRDEDEADGVPIVVGPGTTE